MSDGNIFISYRRGADSNAAGRLHDRLERHFDKDRLFFDVDAIPLGVDFAEYIDTQVGRCRVQLVLIGQGWLEAQDRLHHEDDFVRIEIEAALRRSDIPVIPVLIEDARMPRREDLPEDLHPLLRRNAIAITHEQFSQLVDGRLVQALSGILEDGAVEPPDLVHEAEVVDDAPKTSPVNTDATDRKTVAARPESGRSFYRNAFDDVADDLARLDNAEPRPYRSFLRKLLIFLLVVALLGVGLFLAAVWYDNYQESQRNARVAASDFQTALAFGFSRAGDGYCAVSSRQGEKRMIYRSANQCFETCRDMTECQAVSRRVDLDKSCTLHMIKPTGTRSNFPTTTCYVKNISG